MDQFRLPVVLSWLLGLSLFATLSAHVGFAGGFSALQFLGIDGAFTGASKPSAPPAPVAAAFDPEPLLSRTGLYADVHCKTIAAANRPFSPQYPLWSDGAAKRRWIYLPPGQKIDTSDMNRWIFPKGTKIWKEFSFAGHRVETRLIEKFADMGCWNSWSFTSYKWDAQESDARIADPAGEKNVAPIRENLAHDIPSAAECFQCHHRGGDPVLGFDVLQLSTERDPNALHGEPAVGINLKTLIDEGRLTDNPSVQPIIPANSPAGRTVLGYFHSNCGSCHNQEGSAQRTGLYLRFSFGSDFLAQPCMRTAVNKSTKWFRPGRLRIQGQDAASSVILYRMRGTPATSTDTNRMMPPTGRKTVDAEAVALVEKWIAQLPHVPKPQIRH